MPSTPMTPEQRQLVEDNMNLVWFTIHKHPKFLRMFEADDLTQIGYLALCEAAMSYRQDGSKFAPYAVCKIYWSFVGQSARENASKRKGNYTKVSLDAPLPESKDDDPVMLCEALPSCAMQMDDLIVLRDMVRAVFDEIRSMKPGDQQIIDGIVRGYTQVEISEMMGIKRPCLCMRIRRIRTALKERCMI